MPQALNVLIPLLWNRPSVVFYCNTSEILSKFYFQMSKRILKTLESTRFANSPVLPVAAKPGGPEVSFLMAVMCGCQNP